MNWKGAVTWCIMLLQKACISNALRVWAVNAVSCCKSCKGYGKGYRKRQFSQDKLVAILFNTDFVRWNFNWLNYQRRKSCIYAEL